MARALKIHLLRPSETPENSNISLCGIVTENSTDDPEGVTCQHCSGFYRTNVEWYSQVKNKAVEGRGQTGEGDLYTRQDLEAGLQRTGWKPEMIKVVLDGTSIFRNVPLPGETPDPWQQTSMGVRIHRRDGSVPMRREKR